MLCAVSGLLRTQERIVFTYLKSPVSRQMSASWLLAVVDRREMFEMYF